MKIEIDYNGSVAKVIIDGKKFPTLDNLKKVQVITGLRMVLKDFTNQRKL